MPTLKRFNNSRVLMYVGDHPPPHVHVRLRDGRECTIMLHTLQVTGPIEDHDLRAPLAWVISNQAALLQEWCQYNP